MTLVPLGLAILSIVFSFHSIFIKPYIYIVIIQFILTCPISCTMIYSDEINQIKSKINVLHNAESEVL
jgi:hypothetical protein